MILVGELRLGNWVYDKTNCINAEVSVLDLEFPTQIGYKTDNGYFVNSDLEFNGIHLVPEILKKCGFESGKGWYMKFATLIEENGKYLVSSEDNEYGFDYDQAIELKYLHQLQNLYFALIGEELKIEL